MPRYVRSILCGFALSMFAAGPAATPAFTAGQDAVEAPVIPSARPGLASLTMPRLVGLETAVVEQIRAAGQALDQAAADSRTTRADLAEAYGSLGQVFHVYEFFEPAEASYANAARLAPGDGRWPHLLGYLYQQTGRLEDAAAQFALARRTQPHTRTATVRLAEVFLQLNRLRDAREEFESVIEVFPGIAQNGLGEIALREGRYQRALEHFRAALERVPQAVSIHYSLAMALRGLGRLDEARRHLTQRGPGGIRVGDPVVDHLQTLVRGERGLLIQGRRAFDAGQFQEAADAYRRAVVAAPRSATARANLGLALSNQNDAAGASEQFAAALLLDANHLMAQANFGLLLVRQGRDRDAVGHLQAAFEQAPEDGDVSRGLLGVLLRLGRKDDAIRVVEKTRSFDPENEDALVGLAILLADGERFQEALALLADAYGRFPERTATATTLARLLASSPDRSLRDGRRALEVAMGVYEADPTAVHLETVALALAELGRCPEAAQWLGRAVVEAEKERDVALRARLAGELSNHDTASCRPGSR